MRAAIDNYSKEYFYIGRNSLESSAKYYENNQINRFNETISQLFGKVHVTHNCLYIPFNRYELIFSEYEILCMKPTSNSLKIIARDAVRCLLKYSNENVELINKNANGLIYIPESLINFIKYPSYLTTGEYMLRNEKIVRDDGKFELVILNNGDLVISSILKNNESNNLNKKELDNLKDTQFKRIIYNSVNSIWLHKFHAIVYNRDYTNNKRVFILKSFSLDKKATDYKLKINNNSTPNLTVVDNEIQSDVDEAILRGELPLFRLTPY